MKAILVVLCLVAASLFASMPQAVIEAPPANPRHFPQKLNSAEHRTSAPAPSWTSLERLTFEERLNSDVHLMSMKPLSEAATAEVGAIEQLWNSGRYDAALARFRDIGQLADPSGFFVGINWRKPVSTVGTDLWGANVRIGTRDSAYCTSFGRNYINGNLLVGMLRHAGAATNIDVNLSTDGGATWSETFDGNWTSGAPPTELEGVCTGNAFFVVYPWTNLNQVLCLKFDGANGTWIPFPSGTLADTVFSTAPAQVTELAICSGDDVNPGQRSYVFGRTDGDSLLFAWTDGTGQPWRRFGTDVNWCGGMIDCNYNPGEVTGNWLWASFMYRRTPDTLHPAFVYIDDTLSAWHANWISNLPTTMDPAVTSLAAWHDTVIIAYTHQGAGRWFNKAVVTYNGGAGWFVTDVPDNVMNRELPDVTGTHGDGFALVQRQYNGGARAIMYTHSGYDGVSWTLQDSISDHAPDYIERPRIQWVSPGVYGVVYTTWENSIYNSVWFNRSDWTGIAEKRPIQPTRFGLQAQAVLGGARLAFTNPVAGDVQLRVFDAVGRMVESRQTFLGVGAQTLGFTSSTSGIYFAELEAAGRTSVAKFFVTR